MIFLTRSIAVDHSFIPKIEVFVALVASTEKGGDMGEVFFHDITLAKDDSYVLINISWNKPDRDLLTSGCITAEQTDNNPLGLIL